MKVKSESEVTQSCPTLSDPIDCSAPGSSVHEIFQAGVLEWGAIAFSSHGTDIQLDPENQGVMGAVTWGSVGVRSHGNPRQEADRTDSGSLDLESPGCGCDEEARGASPRRSLESLLPPCCRPGASLQLVTQRVPAALPAPATVLSLHLDFNVQLPLGPF